jgi:hypothetical protein
MSHRLARDAAAMATTANKALQKNRQKIEGKFPHYLHGGAERERNLKSRTTRRFADFGGRPKDDP